MRVPLSFYSRSALEVAPELIGAFLVHHSREGITSGRIVEAEAYRGEDDPASFAWRGRTPKSERLYGPPGKAFIYLNYGIHWLLNVVTETEDFPGAVLIRAVEPGEGISLMEQRRKTRERKNLCSGPAKTCEAFGLDGTFNGVPLHSLRSSLFIEKNYPHQEELVWRPRVGIREGKDRLWRVYIKNNRYISCR
ncbi:DNA-3-methyladenine glycosylase [bacterium]|nr:DNA-3-methyladenine glycosylase [bacterium]